MKKMLVTILSLVMVFSAFAVLASADDALSALEIPKLKAAPTIDGVLDEGEYYLIGSLEDGTLRINDSTQEPEAEFYAGWTDTDFYYAIKVACNEPHVAYAEGDHHIFNAHHVMSALIPDDPTKDIYVGSEEGNRWKWADVYSGNYVFEWTTILNSKTNSVEMSDHFLSMTTAAGTQMVASSADGYDVYEFKIPFDVCKTEKNGNVALKAESGTSFGLDFTIGLDDVGDGYEGTAAEDGTYRGTYLWLGRNFDDARGKKLSECRILILGDEPREEESSSAAESSNAATSSAAASSKPASKAPDTGDNGYIMYVIIAVVAVAVVAGIILVMSRKKSIAGDEDN